MFGFSWRDIESDGVSIEYWNGVSWVMYSQCNDVAQFVRTQMEACQRAHPIASVRAIVDGRVVDRL